MSENLLETIEELEQEASRLRRELHDVNRRLRECREAAAEFHVGDVVEAQTWVADKGIYDWKEAIVRAVHFTGAIVNYDVSFRRVNGEWSKQVRTWVAGVRALPC